MPRAIVSANRSRGAVLVVLLAGLAAVFLLPFHIPVRPAISDAYTFGFNNRAALGLFLLFAGVFAYWTGGLGLVAAAPENTATAPPMSRRLLGITLGITAFVTVAFWLAYRTVGAINEGFYLMDRLQHLAAGETLYRDFEFIYGPLLLYIPLTLHRVFGLGLLDAYYLAWVLEWTGGTFLLWLTVSWASASSPRKNAIYLLAFLGFIFSCISLGLNYTPLRFVSGPFLAMACWRLLARSPSAVPMVLVSLLGAAWTLLLSPEQGIAFCGGTLLFFLLFVERSQSRWISALVTLLLGQALLLALLLHSGVVHYMRGMAQGGYNLPLLPSTNTLITLLLLLVAACVLWNSLRLRHPGGPLEYLILISLCALPAAFGRCDGGHMFMNTLGAFIAAWTVLSYHRHAGRWMLWSYLAGAIFLPLALYQANNFFMYPVKAALFSPTDPHPVLRQVATSALGRLLGPTRTAATLAKWRALYPVTQPSNLLPGSTLLAPLGYPSTLLLPGLPPITNGRYRGLSNVMAPYEVQEKIDELQSRPQTLLLLTSPADCPLDTASAPPSLPSHAALQAADHQKRRELFLNLLPFYLPHVRHRVDLLAPVCRYIAANYEVASYTAPLVGGLVLQRKQGH